MTINKIYAVLIPLTFVFALLSAPCAHASGVGTVTYVDGRVDILKAGQDRAVPLRGGEEVGSGDAVRTKANSKAEVRFDDGSTVRLAQNTRIEVKTYELDKDNNRKSATIALERGKARAIIAKMKDAAKFTIMTPNAEGEVKGSDIVAFYQAGSSGIMVSEGSMLVRNNAHPETGVLVGAGKSALVSLNEAPTEPRPYLDLEKRLHEQDTFVPPHEVRKADTTAVKGAIASMKGDVRITRRGSDSPRKAAYNDIIEEGDYIETGNDGFIEIKFDNGCGMALKPLSQLKITKLVIDPKTGEYLNLFESSRGKLKTRIENLKGGSRFEVRTPTAVCGARGTFMYLDITPTMAKAFFEGGEGYIINLISGAEQPVGAGSNGSADNQGNAPPPAPTTNEEREGWTQGWDFSGDQSGYSAPGSDAGPGLGGATGGAGNNNTDTFAGGYNGTDHTGGNLRPLLPANNTETPLAPAVKNVYGIFGSRDDDTRDPAFGHYYNDGENGGKGLFFDSGAMSGAIYGDEGPWDGPIPVAVLGEYSNPAAESLWGCSDLRGATGDGAQYFGVMGGAVNNVSKVMEGLFIALYIRWDGEGYRVGYLKSADLEGRIYPYSTPGTDGLFGLNGFVSSYLDRPTDITPDSLAGIVSESNIRGGYFSGTVSGDMEGTIDGDPLDIRGQRWGLWKAGLGGRFVRASPETWHAVAGGAGEGEDGAVNSVWIGAISGNKQPGDMSKAIIAGLVIDYEKTQIFEGDLMIDGRGQQPSSGLGAGVYLDADFAEEMRSSGVEISDIDSKVDIGAVGGRSAGFANIGAIKFCGFAMPVSWEMKGVFSGQTMNFIGEKQGVWGSSGGGTFDSYMLHPNVYNGDDFNWNFFSGGNFISDKGYWLGNSGGSGSLNEGKDKVILKGILKGIWFLPVGGGSANVRMGTLSGDVEGYIDLEGEPGVWNGLEKGPWVEVSDILNEHAIFGEGGLNTLGNFINNTSLPITEVYSGVLRGGGSFGAGGAISVAAMDMSIYAHSPQDSNGIWAAIIKFDYSGPTGPTFNTVINNANGQLNLDGKWNEVGTWTADVSGIVDNKNITGQLGGTHGDGKGSGGGGGIWTSCPDESERT